MPNPRFHTVDHTARNGECHLLEDDRGHLHSGRWLDGAWRYSSGQPIGHPICRYAMRAEVPTRALAEAA